MRTRTATLALTALVLLLSYTAASSSAAGPYTPIRVSQPLAPAASPTSLWLTAAARYIPASGTRAHSAFPSIARTPDGELLMVWRGATDHSASRDGLILSATSTDDGRTWSPATALLATAGVDYRDPSVSYIDGHQYLTYYTGSAQLAAEGAYVSRDGAPAVRIDSLPYAAISAPVVKLPDGRLGVAFYGQQAGEDFDTAFMGWSADLGQTWTTNRIMNDGPANSHAEPYLVVDGATIHFFARWGSWSSIAVRSSTNSGAAGSWGPTRRIIDGCTGRPSATRTASGLIVLVCRGLLPKLGAQTMVSFDHTGSWWPGPVALAAPAGTFVGMTYAALIPDVLPGVHLAVVGMEQNPGSSALYSTYLAEGVQ